MKLPARENITILNRILNGDRQAKVLNLLAKKSNLTVTDIYTTIKLDQATVSTFLSEFLQVGIVTNQRKGKFIRYTLDKKRLAKVRSAWQKINTKDINDLINNLQLTHESKQVTQAA